MKTVQLLIDGQWTAASNGATRDIINPATEAVIGTLAVAQTDDLLRAARAAQRAFPEWSRSSPAHRSAILRKAAALLRERSNDIAPLITAENGKTLAESHAEVAWAAEFYEWFAEEGRRTYGRVVPARASGVR